MSDKSTHAKNPRNNPDMRRFSAILNAKYQRENPAIQVLDHMRQQVTQTGKIMSDRAILVEALIALGEKMDDGWRPLELTSERTVSHQLAALVDKLASIVDGLDFSGTPSSHKAAVIAQLDTVKASIINTSNLMTGDSYRLDTVELDDWDNE